jgi:hypothetical protein
MHARVSFYDVGDADTAVKGFQPIAGEVTQLEGNRGISFLIDRDGGKAITIVYYDTREQMEATVERANDMRQRAAKAGGATVRAVEHYEVAFEEGR